MSVIAQPVKQSASRKSQDPKVKHRSKAAGKGTSTQVHKKAARKTRSQPSVKAVMKQYSDARPSDVSELVFVARSPVHGLGLFAARPIRKGTVIGRLVGMPTYDDGIYVLWITDDLGLELINDLRYINHDSDPNTEYTDVDVCTLRDIKAGEELLHDYGW